MAPSSPSAPNSLTRRSGIVHLLLLAISLVAGMAIVATLFIVLGIPRSGSGWIWTVGLAIVGAWIAWVVLSIGQRSSEALAAGTSDADAARGDRFEATGRQAGKVVGGGIAKVTGRSKHSNEGATDTADSEPESTRTERPSLDDTARALGRMVGRRLGPKRKDQ